MLFSCLATCVAERAGSEGYGQWKQKHTSGGGVAASLTLARAATTAACIVIGFVGVVGFARTLLVLFGFIPSAFVRLGELSDRRSLLR